MAKGERDGEIERWRERERDVSSHHGAKPADLADEDVFIN